MALFQERDQKTNECATEEPIRFYEKFSKKSIDSMLQRKLALCIKLPERKAAEEKRERFSFLVAYSVAQNQGQ